MKSMIATLTLAALVALGGPMASQASAMGGGIAKPAVAEAQTQTVHTVGKRRFGRKFGFKRRHFGKRKFVHKKRFYHHKRHYHGGGCSWLRRKWKYTGRFYWKKRYYNCRGWW